MYNLILVDDEPWALKGLSEIIPWAEYGFVVCGYCGNAAEALAVFRQNEVDAVFTDIRMPGLSGVELIAEIKKLKPEVECVIVSAYSDFEAARKALEYQASAYILKPLEEDEVKKTAARVRANLDSRTGNTHPLLINDAESLARFLPKIEQAIKPGWRYAVLYSGEIPGIAADRVELIIGGASVKAAFFSVPGKADFPGGCEQGGFAFSRRHERCGLEMLREASLSGCGGFAWANHFAVSEIQYHIARRYRDNFSLGDLAARFSIAENYLGELFKKHTGDTMVNFIRSVRMENAGRLLKYTNSPLKEVAWECGFPDISYFGRSFKNHFGITPAQFQDISDAKYRRPNFFIPWLPQ
ncbi:MAG: response regulator [Treponema sp.]|jgi:two-component system response regulator YesN|nr:response regulator [Treponema sp.]